MLASSVDSSMAQSDHTHYTTNTIIHIMLKKKKEIHILSKSENTNLFI